MSLPGPRKKVVIIGAGPVGALAGLYFSHLNWDVSVFELRSDLRLPQNRAAGSGKSINLALSDRGISGISNIGDGGSVLTSILADTIPMYGRMIHSGKIEEDGQPQNYDVHGRYIRSADRAELNIALLDALEKRKKEGFSVSLQFGWKLKSLQLEDMDGAGAELVSREGDKSLSVMADLVIGADGAHSAVRSQLMRYTEMNYSQTYISTHWVEFTIPPHPSTGDFQLSANHLHIWPKHTYMFIAIPSPDKSFTCTLFMPPTYFSQIADSEFELLSFFNKNFPDVISYIGADSICSQYFGNEHLPLVSIRCSPYHYKDRCVILGDAAHAMVPFYGQGMNAGFESVERLCAHIALEEDLAKALEKYTKERVPDAHAIVELAMRNYDEMRSGVTSQIYLLKKGFEESVYRWIPKLGIRTLYSLVSFGTERYSIVLERSRQQEKWEDRAVLSLLGLGLTSLALWTGLDRAVIAGLRETIRFWRGK